MLVSVFLCLEGFLVLIDQFQFLGRMTMESARAPDTPRAYTISIYACQTFFKKKQKSNHDFRV